MSGPLKIARQERFAQELAKGKPQDKAYVIARYKPCTGHASRLAANGMVRARVAELKGRAAEKAVVTAADIALQLDEDRAFARSVNQAGAMVSASLGKAKVLGLIKEKHEHTGKDGAPIEYANLSDEEVTERIAQHEAASAGRPTAH